MDRNKDSFNYVKVLEENKLFRDKKYHFYSENFIYSRIFSERKPNKFKSKLTYIKNMLLRVLYFFYSKVAYSQSAEILSLNASIFDKGLQEKYLVTKFSINASRGIPVFGSFKLFFKNEYLNYHISFSSIDKLRSLEGFVKNIINNIADEVLAAGIKIISVGEDTTFWPRVLLQVSKDKGLRSVLISHGGIPSLYDGTVDTKSDLLLVWGKMQKDSYVMNSYNPKRIKVIGHPRYSGNNVKFNEKINLNNILLLTKSICAIPPSDLKLYENPNLILKYLVTIKMSLKELGINSVNLRLHPSEDIGWYKELLIDRFFNITNSCLDNDLNDASLIIGPTSTVFIDAISKRKPYIFFEPLDSEGNTIFGYPLVEPIKNNSLIPLVHTKKDLKAILERDYKYDFSGFIGRRFDYSVIQDDS